MEMALWASLTIDETFGSQLYPQRMPGDFAANSC